MTCFETIQIVDEITMRAARTEIELFKIDLMMLAKRNDPELTEREEFWENLEQLKDNIEVYMSEIHKFAKQL